MSAAQALAASPETVDGDGDPPTGAEIAGVLAAALERIRDRGPLFKKLVDEALEFVQIEVR